MTQFDLETVEEAMFAFWRTVAERYPNITTGDLSIFAEHQFAEACEIAVHAWLWANQREEVQA